MKRNVKLVLGKGCNLYSFILTLTMLSICECFYNPSKLHAVTKYLSRKICLSARQNRVPQPTVPYLDVSFEQQLKGIRSMRRHKNAAVDNYGTGAISEQSQGLDGKAKRFEVLVAAMLSSQTQDPVTAAAVDRLRELCATNGGLSPSVLLHLKDTQGFDEEALAKVLSPVSFHERKAMYIFKVCNILREQYSEDIPRSLEDLLDLPGVGPKMAILVMDIAWNEVAGICVDTHVHRLSNRLGWVDTWNYTKPKSQNPEKTRKQLEAWIPRDLWRDINPLLVGLGQQVCPALGPKCSECQINQICPSAFQKKYPFMWKD
mmetsp:Transcript_3694/g.5167  ORF Transcript_3694/g.5167 Transcript_3694/m.5167 type:complete len:317 (-) Transcript_3694:300-1250(-)